MDNNERPNLTKETTTQQNINNDEQSRNSRQNQATQYNTGYNQQNMNYNQQNMDNKDNNTIYFVLSIFELLCCCMPAGIIALVLLLVKNDDNSNLNSVKLVLKVGLIYGIVAYAISFISSILLIVKVLNF